MSADGELFLEEVEEGGSATNLGEEVTTSDHDDDDEEAAETPELARKEGHAVMALRILLVMVFLVSPVLASIGVYRYVRDSEEDEFEASFSLTAHQILDSVGVELDALLGGADGMALTRISIAKSHNETFPFSTLPSAGNLGSNFLAQSKARQFLESLVVEPQEREEWEKYSRENNGWVEDVTNAMRQDASLAGQAEAPRVKPDFISNNYLPPEAREAVGEDEVYLTTWIAYPHRPPRFPVYNADVLSVDATLLRVQQAFKSKNVVLSEFLYQFNSGLPFFSVEMPLLDRGDSTDFSDVDVSELKLLGIHTFMTQFETIFEKIVPEDVFGIHIVTRNACDQIFTFELNGKEWIYLNNTDGHDPSFDEFEVSRQLIELTDLVADKRYRGPPIDREFCPISFSIYPSQATKDSYTSNDPRTFAIVVVAMYVFTIFLLVVYDLLVSRRQSIVMKAAVQSTSIVASLFPSNVRGRLFGEPGKREDKPKPFLAKNAPDASASPKEPPVADLYTDATVLFADIAGFTAWSSAREPTQVFVLLEALYGSFDELAKKRRVFKVETIGDSYVAVSGLPEPRKEHAVVMVRFAREILDAMNLVCNSLVVQLGPDTLDLSIRVGLHSGAVTAGVLRGERARFQLFGDTVNTAARMESNGVPGKIQASQATADALAALGKPHWVQKREELIDAKGKGKMQTYWVNPKAVNSSRDDTESLSDTTSSHGLPEPRDKRDGLIAWNTETLCALLRNVVGARGFVRNTGFGQQLFSSSAHESILFERIDQIMFHKYDQDGSSSGLLSDEVETQIKDFVTAVASLYPNLPFHNFENATYHVMSLNTMIGQTRKMREGSFYAANPLAEFAMTMGVLIHAIGHPGVSNQQLVLENDSRAALYHGRCIIEQNAFSLAMKLLMDTKYNDLRNAIAATSEEWNCFRQVLVNSVLATDTDDADLQEQRQDQWDACFSHASSLIAREENDDSRRNRMTTIFIEYMVQSSVLCLFMQDWGVYSKWLERQMLEENQASEAGRAVKKSDSEWAHHQVSLFDSLIIPLATKLNMSKLLGGIGLEQLNFAKQNLQECRYTEAAADFPSVED